MDHNKGIPRFVSWVAIVLGSLDLIRGFMHTILLGHAAANIAGLDLSTAQAGDLLQLMGAFGISNYITGAMLILLGWKARPLALAMLGVIPIAYAIGQAGIRTYASSYEPSAAAWGGVSMMLAYLAISAITFLAGLIVMRARAKASDPGPPSG